jgi:hypothetical protein
MPNTVRPLDVNPIVQFGTVGATAEVARIIKSGGMQIAGDDVSNVTVPLIVFHSKVGMEMPKTVGNLGCELERVL